MPYNKISGPGATLGLVTPIVSFANIFWLQSPPKHKRDFNILGRLKTVLFQRQDYFHVYVQ